MVRPTGEHHQHHRCSEYERAADIDRAHTCQALTAIIVAVEHFRNNRSSQPPALYLLVNLLLGISRIRTLAVLSSPSDPIVAALGAVIGLELSLFVLLQISSRPWLKDGGNLPSSATAGIVSRLLVSWTLPLLWSGYRRPLTAETIGPIDSNLHTDISAQYFEPQWETQRQRYRAGKTKYPLLWACIRARPLVLAAPLLPWLISAVIGMARPLIVLHTVNYVETASENPNATAEAWALIGGTLLVFGIYAIATAMGTLASQYTGLAIKASLMEAIYRKSLRLKTEVAREMGAAKASNLMGSDLDLVVMVSIGATRQHASLCSSFCQVSCNDQLCLDCCPAVRTRLVHHLHADRPLLCKSVTTWREQHADWT